MRLPGQVNVGVQSVGRVDTRLPARVAAASAGAANEFAAAMGAVAGGFEEFERRESEAQYAEAITKFEREEILLRQQLSSSRKYTQEQLSDWGVQPNPAWRADPETGEVEASEAMSEIYQQLVQQTYDETFSGITAPTAKEQFGSTVPRAIARAQGDVIAQQRKLYLDTFAARQISAAAQHMENGNAELAIASYESARDAGALTARQAQDYIDAAPAQAEMHIWSQLLRAQDAGSMQGGAAALRSPDYRGELDEESRHRVARTLEANADAIESEGRKERYQAEFERVLQAEDAGSLQTLMTAYKQTGASQRLGLDPTQLGALYQAANSKLLAAERRMQDRSQAAAAEMAHDRIIRFSRGEGLDGDPLGEIDAEWKSGMYGPPESESAMRVHRQLNSAVIQGTRAKVKREALQIRATNHMSTGAAIPADDPDRNKIAEIQFMTAASGGMPPGEAIARVASVSKALPESVQNMFKSVAYSPANPQVQNAAALFDQIRNRGGADALQFDLTDDEFDRMSYLADTVRAGVPVSNAFEVLERQSKMTDKERADALAAWRGLQKEGDTSFRGYFEKQMPGFFTSLFVDQPEITQRAMDAAEARAETIYMAYGDAGFANQQAYDWFRRRYGVSTLNGVSEFSFHGPETTYGTNADGTPVISGDEARRQVVEDITALGYSQDSLVRIEPTNVMGKNGKPVYAIWVENPDTRIVELLPQAWQPDPARRLEFLGQKRESEFAQQEEQLRKIEERARSLDEVVDPAGEMRFIFDSLNELHEAPSLAPKQVPTPTPELIDQTVPYGIRG